MKLTAVKTTRNRRRIKGLASFSLRHLPERDRYAGPTEGGEELTAVKTNENRFQINRLVFAGRC